MQSDSILLLKTDKSPLPKQAGILLAIPAMATGDLTTGSWLHGSLSLSDLDLMWAPVDVWFQSLVVTAISRANQFPYLTSIVGERVVFPEEIHYASSTEGSQLVYLAFNIKVVAALNLRPETYFLHATCLSHRSDTIEIRCG
jgi:hypothetical protein